MSVNGALLIHKPEGMSSFGVVERLQKVLLERENAARASLPGAKPASRRRDLPKMGHGGTLDPFATGLLVVCVGKAVKLARYFLGSTKAYEGIIRFGETTIPGDPTAPISETSSVVPQSREEIQKVATMLTLQPYLQTPPMHSAKKKDGKPLYELAREGIEVEREAKECLLFSFEILGYERGADGKVRAPFRLTCSSGTYVRTLAQDLARILGSVALLETLHRTASGNLNVQSAWTVDRIAEATAANQSWDQLPCWVGFDRLLDGFDRAEATDDEARALVEGRQNVLFNILKRVTPAEKPSGPSREHVAIYRGSSLIAVANQTRGEWGLERVFT